MAKNIAFAIFFSIFATDYTKTNKRISIFFSLTKQKWNKFLVTLLVWGRL